MLIEVTHANTKEKMSLTVNLIFAITEKKDGTAWVMAAGGAIAPVVESKKQVEEKINDSISEERKRDRNKEPQAGND